MIARRNTPALPGGLVLLGGACALVGAPGLLAAYPLSALWRHRATAVATRWGCAVSGGLATLFLVPAFPWTWPGALLDGGSLGSVAVSAATEILLAPLAAQLLALCSPAPAPVSAATVSPPAAAIPPHLPALVRLGTDVLGRPVELDLAGEATIAVIGLPGKGKTMSLIRLAAESVRLGWSVVVLDLKGSGAMARAVKALAAREGLPLQLFDPSDPASLGYNPCAGRPDEVASKLCGSFSFDGVADVYSQVGLVAITRIVAALQGAGKPFRLDDVVAAFEATGLADLQRIYRELDKAARTAGLPPPDMGPLARLEGEIASAKAARLVQEGHLGIAKRLAALAEGAFNELLRREDTIDLAAASSATSLTYLGLPSLARPTDVALLAKVLLQELKVLADARLRQPDRVPMLLIIDELAALGEATQLVDLLLQSREAGIVVVASSQFLPRDPALRAALLGAGVVVAHGVATQDADLLAAQFGTHPVSTYTTTVDHETGTATRSALRRDEDDTVPANRLRELGVGEAALRVVKNRQPLRHRIIHVQREDI